MDPRQAAQEFLTSRRAQLTPERAGLVTYGDTRRVKGLRREEVALLAGVSVDYYARLERGSLAGVSDSVLDAVARALQLDEVETQHLYDLARSAQPTPRAQRRPKPPEALRPSVLGILMGMTGIPAYVRDNRMNVLAANELCQALYGGALDDERLPVNLARYVFLDPHSRGFFLDWDVIADDFVGSLRLEAGRNPRDRGLGDLIGELAMRSDAFAVRWARQSVHHHGAPRKRLHNRLVGDIELVGDGLELMGDGLVLIAYTAATGSPAEDQLRLLASWAATDHGTERTTLARDRRSEHHA